jgi:hypothetical protein
MRALLAYPPLSRYSALVIEIQWSSVLAIYKHQDTCGSVRKEALYDIQIYLLCPWDYLG